MYAYPTTLDSDAITVLLAVLEGKPSLPSDVHALWDIVGFGLGRILPDSAPSTLTHAELALQVRAAADHGLLSGLPWGQIVTILLPILGQLLQGILTKPTTPS